MTNLFIVNRERPELFDRLRAHFKDEPEAEIVWDRRTGERRLAPRRRTPRPGERDRRFFERRGALPDSWAVPGFVFVAGNNTRAEEPGGGERNR